MQLIKNREPKLSEKNQFLFVVCSTPTFDIEPKKAAYKGSLIFTVIHMRQLPSLQAQSAEWLHAPAP